LSRNTIAGAVLALSRHPEQHRRLVEDPGLLPTAIEEFLRWVTAKSRFFFNDTATTEIYTLTYTLSLHDALPI
jgi:cytochrome P450 family 142 subfamily A polypeptide 1